MAEAVNTAPEVAAETLSQHWGPVTLADERYYEWACPTLRLWFRRKKRTMAFSFDYLDETMTAAADTASSSTDTSPEADPASGSGDAAASSGGAESEVSSPPPSDPFIPSERVWDYRVLNKSPRKLSILPVLPDKPILFNLASPVVLLPGSSTSVFISLRLWLRFVDPNDAAQTPIREIPTVLPNKAWFGVKTTSGEVCYWRKETASLTPDGDEDSPHLVLCPVTVYNRSENNLTLSTMYLRASTLSIFTYEGRLYTDRVQVTYTGEKEVSQVRVSGKAPPFASEATLLTGPREPIGRIESAMASAWNLLTSITMGEDE